MKWTDKLDGEFNGSPCKIRVGVSETYSESAILKLTKMVLNINDFNTCEFGDLESDVCIGQEYLQQMKELARDIIDNDYKIASLNNFRDFASNEEWVTWCNFWKNMNAL